MAKRKSRRTRRTGASRSATFGRVRSSDSSSEPTTTAQLEAQYQYVIDDLKRIGLIAVTLIGALVILSFFIT
ncbi:MAG: hypothetical protein JXB30_05965 [Anaerolineae bacterium]|nr:hypothetical protein [Anaerolineae bacterium]